MAKILYVYLNRQLTGILTESDTGSLSFKYTENANPISVSIPYRENEYLDKETKAFFSALLPDSIVRRRLAKYLGISGKNSFALLEAVGGECAGALALYPRKRKDTDKIQEKDILLLDDKKLENILDLLKYRPLMAGEKGLRMSLAGAQDKIALGVINSQLALFTGDIPTTHILKPSMEDYPDSVFNEVFCMQLAASLDIEVPKTEIRYLKGKSYYLIERYDRKIGQVFKSKEALLEGFLAKVSPEPICRLHQEDFCQALSIIPEHKYESEGGPSAKLCSSLLDKYSSKPAADRIAFIRLLIFNFLIGNADAHAKNYSLLYKNAIPELAPAYDLLSTAVYPDLSHKLAMSIGGEFNPEKIKIEHWLNLIPDTASAQRLLIKEIKKTSKNCMNKALALRQKFKDEGNFSQVIDDICRVIEKRVGMISGF